jgi:undecaprenyl-diphosphatase
MTPPRLHRTIAMLSAPDHAMMARLNHWQAPRWVQVWMRLASRAGDGWFFAVAGMGLLFFGDYNADRAVLCSALALLAGVAVFCALKRMVGRERPSHLLRPSWVDLIPPDRFSFPSGHSLTSFAFAASLSHWYPALEWPLAFLAVNIAVSRIVLGMHFLSDVLAGSILGILVGSLAATWFVFNI